MSVKRTCQELTGWRGSWEARRSHSCPQQEGTDFRGNSSLPSGAAYLTPMAGAKKVREKMTRCRLSLQILGVTTVAVLTTLRDMASPWEVTSSLAHTLASEEKRCAGQEWMCPAEWGFGSAFRADAMEESTRLWSCGGSCPNWLDGYYFRSRVWQGGSARTHTAACEDVLTDQVLLWWGTLKGVVWALELEAGLCPGSTNPWLCGWVLGKSLPSL